MTRLPEQSNYECAFIQPKGTGVRKITGPGTQQNSCQLQQVAICTSQAHNYFLRPGGAEAELSCARKTNLVQTGRSQTGRTV